MTDIAMFGLGMDTTGLKKGEKGLDNLTKAGERTEGSMKGLQRTALAAFTTFASFQTLKAATNQIAAFEDSMLGLQATIGGTAADMAKLEKQARSLGASSIYSASEAAQGQRFLAQAGFDLNETLSATPDILKLATAGQLSLASAADLASNVLGGMRLEVDQLNRVNDVLAKTASSSNTNIEQLGQALSYAAPIAAGAGISIEEASAAIGKLSDNGLQGTRAGTGLLGVIRQLSKITPQAAAALESYGLSTEDVNIESNGLSNVLNKLRLANINTADSFEIFGSEAGPAAQILAANSREVVQLTTKLQDATGAASEMAGVIGSGLSASFKAFNSQVSESVLQLGEHKGAFKDLVDGATGVIAVYNGMIDEFAEANDLTLEQQKNIEVLAEGLKDSSAVVFAAGGAYAAYTVLVKGATAATAAFSAATRANPIGLMITLLGAAGGALYAFSGDIGNASDAMKILADETGRFSDNQKEAAKLSLAQQQVKLQERLVELQKQYENQSPRGRVGVQKNIDQTNESLREIESLLNEINATKVTLNIPEIAAFSGDETVLGIKGYTDEVARLTAAYAPLITQEQQLKSDQAALNNLIAVASAKDLPALQAALVRVNAEMAKLPPSTDGGWLSDFNDTFGEGAAESLASALINGDWGSVGSSLGTVLGGAMGGPIGGIIGGAVVGGLFSGKSETGSSTKINLNGSNVSGYNQTNYSSLFGSSSSKTDLSSASISAIGNSVALAQSTVTNALKNMGFGLSVEADTFNSSVETASGDLAGGVDELTEAYVNANAAYIEDFQRVNETAVDALTRLSELLSSVEDSFDISTSGQLTAAADSYIAEQASVIDASTAAILDSLKSQQAELKSELEALPVSGDYDADWVKAGQINKQLTALATEIVEQTSRLGTGLEKATIEFSSSVTDVLAEIYSISADDAATLLDTLSASYEENYYTATEQLTRAIGRAEDDLAQYSDLGVDASTSLDDFQSAFEAFVASDAFTPEGYARWLAAADSLAELNNASEDLGDTFTSITDFVKELMGLEADGTQSLASARAAYEDALTAAGNGDEEAISKLATLADTYLSIAADSAATSADLATVRAGVIGGLTSVVPAFASGGFHSGGVALVGEEGPELVNMGPSQVYSNSDSAKMLDNSNLLEAVNRLIDIMQSGQFAIAKNTKNTYDVLTRIDKGVVPLKVEVVS